MNDMLVHFFSFLGINLPELSYQVPEKFHSLLELSYQVPEKFRSLLERVKSVFQGCSPFLFGSNSQEERLSRKVSISEVDPEEDDDRRREIVQQLISGAAQNVFN